MTIVPDQLMQHGTQGGLCGQIYLQCTGHGGPEESKHIFKTIAEKVAELEIPAHRLFIYVNEVKANQQGVAGIRVDLLGLDELMAKSK